MAFQPYLTFAGNCRDAFTRYREIFGGELNLLTMADAPADAGSPGSGVKPDAIMHALIASARRGWWWRTTRQFSRNEPQP